MKDRFTNRLWVQMAFLFVVYLVIHIPTIQLGPLRDDIFILSKCETTNWSDLLINGFRFTRTDFGNVWWITVKDIAHFFRPLLLVTYKLTIAVTGNIAGIHHLINILIHIGTSMFILCTGRRLLKSTMAPFAGAAFFLFSMHNQWTVMWIVARKELLVGLFMLMAFNFHLSKSTWKTTLAMMCGMMCGEHAVAFPFIAVAWDLLSSETKEKDIPFHKRFRKQWLLYFGALGAYIVVRHLLLGGLPLPPSPYFTHPLSEGAWSFYALKDILFASALTLSILFIDRPVMAFWMNYPISLFLSVLLTGAVLWWAYTVSGKNRLFPVFLLLSFLSFLPFTPMVAMPIYLYTPMIFFSIAVSVSLDKTLHSPKDQWLPYCRNFVFAVVVTIILHTGGTTIWTYSRFNETFSYPVKVAPQIGTLVRAFDKERPLVLIDLPAHALTLPFLLQHETGRIGEHITAVSMQVGKDPEKGSSVRKSGHREWIIENKKVPYFENPRARALAFLPKGLLKKNLKVKRNWFTVTINELGPEPEANDRGHRFFTTEPSVHSIKFTIEEHCREPVFVLFKGEKPIIWSPEIN